MTHSLAHVFDGISHGEIMIPDKNLMEKSPLTQVIEPGGNQDDIPVEGGLGDAIILIKKSDPGPFKITTGSHFDSGKRDTAGDVGLELQ